MASDSSAVVRWRRLVELFESRSGTVAEFCQAHRVSAPSVYQWRQRLASTADFAVGPGKPPMPTPILPTFVPLKLNAAIEAEPIAVRVRFSNGTVLELPAAREPALRTVIEALLTDEVRE